MVVPVLQAGFRGTPPDRPKRTTVATDPLPRCRMAACDNPPDPTWSFCEPHLLRFVNDPMWTPIKVLPMPDADPGVTIMVCGLCRTHVQALVRLDDGRGRMYVLDDDAHPDGRCLIILGGFRLVAEKQQQHLAGSVPFYRAHAPACARRPKPIDVVL